MEWMRSLNLIVYMRQFTTNFKRLVTLEESVGKFSLDIMEGVGKIIFSSGKR